MNRVELQGRLTRDVELLETKDKKSKYARFSLAVPRKSNKEETDFFDCVAFGKLGEIINQYCKKGIKIIICGSIQINNYTSKEGENKKATVIIVDDFYFCDSKKGE